MILEVNIYDPLYSNQTNYRKIMQKVKAKINISKINYISVGFVGISKAIIFHHNFEYSGFYTDELTYDDVQKLTNNYFTLWNDYLINKNKVIAELDEIIYFDNNNFVKKEYDK